MKKIITLILVLVLCSSCGSTMTKEMKESTITYQASSRGFYVNIEIQDNKMTVIRERNSAGEEASLSHSQLEDFEKLYQKVTLKELENYKAPTEKRFYDGAAIATFSVNYQGKTYNSQAFDHGSPPVEIAELVNKMVSFIEN